MYNYFIVNKYHTITNNLHLVALFFATLLSYVKKKDNNKMDNIFDLFKKLEKTNSTDSTVNTQGSIEYIVVGLGNPEAKYNLTRHNAGFAAVDKIAAHFNTSIKKIRFKGLTGEITINSHKILLLKPSTFMNLSGQSVTEAMNFYKVPIDKVIVIYDDISLDPSFIRIRRKGSHGGHNGIKNIIYLSGKDTFPRIKLGVGKKPSENYDLANWVLSNFKKEELALMEKAYINCVDIISLIVDGKIDEAMNKYNV